MSALLAEIASAPDVPAAAAWDEWLRPGAVIGRFELVREIGRGGFGLVWEARDTQLGRMVAFKALRPGLRPDLRQERLLREAELAAQLAHPGIVTVYDVGRSEHGPYLVLELLRGRPLAARLADGPVPLGEAIRIAIEVTRAVAHAHRHGVVHRDLKPGNVFLCDGGSIKVLDFGLARALGDARVAGGTPAYMAPEQARGAPEDERTDLFALGVMLHRMVTGELPFPERDGGASPASRAPALDVTESPALAALVGRLLEPDPARRPRDAEDVLGALADCAREVRSRAARGEDAAGDEPVTDDRAREYYLRGRRYLRQTRKRSLGFASEMFARAIAIDPGYALAHAAAAEAAALHHLYYPPDEERLRAAERASARAVELRPDLAEAHVARGLALFLARRHDEARRAFERALALDAALFEARYYFARASFQQGRMEEAARLFREANAIREDFQASFFAAQASEALGRAAEARDGYRAALAVVERYMDLEPDDPRAATMRAVALCRLGRRDEGLRWAEQALTLDPQDAGVGYNVACLYALEGAVDAALAQLERVVRAGFRNKEWMERDPDLASLRGLPRFEALLEAL
jgi:tetratricopeptide (TPR) repeat protein